MPSFWSGVQKMDAYPKTLDEFNIRTYQGGIISLVAFGFMLLLFISELNYYLEIETVDKMTVDGRRGQKVQIQFDISFPRMPCSLISMEAGDQSGNVQSDIEHKLKKMRLDLSGRPLNNPEPHSLGGSLKNESHISEKETNNAGKINKCGSCYGAEKPGQCCNTCEDVKLAYAARDWDLPSLHTIDQCMQDDFEDIFHGRIKEGCNLHGHIEVEKVQGRFQFAPAKIFQHGYLQPQDLVNFTFKAFDNSHHINTLVFGEKYPNMKNPLDNRKKELTKGDYGVYQYYLKVVPTDYQYISQKVISTNQYSVTEYFLKVKPLSGKGLPGVSFDYDFSPIMFAIEQRKRPILQFFTSVCAIIGGVFTIMGVLDSFIFSLVSKTSSTPLKQ